MREPFHKFRLIVNVLLIGEILLGCAIILVTAAYQHILCSFMTRRQSNILWSKFLNSYLLGFELIAMYTCSMSMWNSVWVRRYSSSIQLLLKMWLYFCSLIIVCGCTTIGSMFNSIDALSEGVALMLFGGIEVYYMNPEWKLLWDQLQYSRECCGVNEYLDWMHASWMPNFVVEPTETKFNSTKDYETDVLGRGRRMGVPNECVGKRPHLPTTGKPVSTGESEFLKNEWSSEVGDEQILAPYACCKHDSVSCLQNYLPRPDSSAGVPHLNLTEINTKGCLPLFNEFMGWFMHLLLILISMAIILDIFTCCLTKYLMIKSERNPYRELDGNLSFFDDDGNALVVVKCPPKVKCITLEEQNSYDSDLPNMCSDTEPCICCCDNDRESIDGNLSKAPRMNEQPRGHGSLLIH